MKRLFKYALAALICPVRLTSCSDDESEKNIEVTFSAIPKVAGALDVSSLEGTPVLFTEVRNQDTKRFPLDAFGRAAVSLPMGVYNIAIEKNITNAQGEQVVVSLRMENISVNASGQVIEGYVNSLPASALGKDFIFSEVFFNGETNSGRMMHPDNYIVLFNPTEDVLYADGVSIGVTMHLSWQNKQLWYDSYYPDQVPIGGFITIPGSGQEHPVQPGEKLVIAFTAINHSEVIAGEVADQVFPCDNVYVVCALSDVFPKGYLTLEQARPYIEQMVRLEKKGEVAMARAEEAVKAGKDVNSIAAKLGTVVDSMSHISFNDFYFGRYGMEPKVQAAVAAQAASGKTGFVGPVRGASGVYMVQIDNIVNNENGNDVSTIQRQQVQLAQQKLSMVLSLLVEKSKITDQRNKFF